MYRDYLEGTDVVKIKKGQAQRNPALGKERWDTCLSGRLQRLLGAYTVSTLYDLATSPPFPGLFQRQAATITDLSCVDI